MEKECIQCKKNYQPKNKTQKFCSVECQYNSYKIQKIEKIKKECVKCGKIYYKIPSKSGSTYCSRECKDLHQKEIYIGEKNPTWGRKYSLNEKQFKSNFLKELWKSQEFRDSIKKGQEKFLLENGYWPGTDENSKEKRKKTMFEKYGITHNWNGNYGKRICDKTTFEKYGKTSVDMLIEYTIHYNKKTDIENIFEEFLKDLKIPFQDKFKIYNKDKIDFWYKEYDFLILNTNILIEVDGDYWHGNEKIFQDLTDFQKSVKINDKIKENFATSNGYEIIRFWGSDIKKNKTEIKEKLKELWEKLNY